MKTLVTCGAGLTSLVVIRHIPSKSDSVANTEKLTFAGSLEIPVDLSQKHHYVLGVIYSLVGFTCQTFFLGLPILTNWLFTCRLSKAAGVLRRDSSPAYIYFF